MSRWCYVKGRIVLALRSAKYLIVALVMFLICALIPEAVALQNIWTQLPLIGDRPSNVGTGQTITSFPAAKMDVDPSHFPFGANDILIVGQACAIYSNPQRSRDYDCLDADNQIHNHNFSVFEDSMHPWWPRWTASGGFFLFFGLPWSIGYGSTPTWIAPFAKTTSGVTFTIYENDDAPSVSNGTRNDAPDPTASDDAEGIEQNHRASARVHAPSATCSVIKSNGTSVSAGCRDAFANGGNNRPFDEGHWKVGTDDDINGKLTTGVSEYRPYNPPDHHPDAWGGGLGVEIQGHNIKGPDPGPYYDGIPVDELDNNNWSVHQFFHATRTWHRLAGTTVDYGTADHTWTATDPGWLPDGGDGGYWTAWQSDVGTALPDYIYAADIPGFYGLNESSFQNYEFVVYEMNLSTAIAYKANNGDWVDLTSPVSWGVKVTVSKSGSGVMDVSVVTL